MTSFGTIARLYNERNPLLYTLYSKTILSQDSDKYVSELVTPIMNCLSDPDLRVRYFACESLYNVVKVARSAIIPFFPEMFAALSRLVTDSDQMVKDGSELLDRLLKVRYLS